MTGTILAGKTTMCKALAEKHGFIWFNYNHNGEPFKKWLYLCEEKYQPLQFARDKRHNKQENYDWDVHFNKSAEEIIAEQEGRSQNDEFLEFVMIELIKLSQFKKVIIDFCAPTKILIEIADHDRIACLLTAPHLVTTANYGSRDDHKDYYNWLLSLNEPEKKIAKQDEVFKITTEKMFKEVRKYNLFSVTRTDESTIEKTMKLLEEHFNLLSSE